MCVPKEMVRGLVFILPNFGITLTYTENKNKNKINNCVISLKWLY